MKKRNWKAELQAPCVAFAPLLSVLPAKIAAIITAVCDKVQCDPGIAFFAFLGVLSAALVGRVVAQPFADNSYREAVQLYIILCAEPGERKNTVIRCLIEPLLTILNQLQAQAAYEAKKVALKIIKAEDTIADAISQAIEKIYGDATLQGLVKAQYAAGGKAIVLNGDADFLHILSGHLFTQTGTVNLMHVLNSFDNDSGSIVRAGKELLMPRLSLSICCGAQKVVLSDFMNSNIGRGLHERFLYVIAVSLAGTRSCIGKEIDPALFLEYKARIEELALFHRDPNTDPYIIHFNPEAETAYRKFHDRIEKRMAPDGDLCNDVIIGWANRICSQAIRIAALIALYVGEESVSLQSWSAAEAIMLRYLIPCAKIAFGIDGLSPIASKIGMRLIGISSVPQTDFLRSIHNNKGMNNSSVCKAALAELEATGLIQLINEEQDTGKPGRQRSPVIHVHPEIAKYFYN